MEVSGTRFLIAGSAAPAVNASLLQYAHELIDLLTSELARAGAAFMLNSGKNPKQSEDPGALPVIFDWTVYSRLLECLKAEECGPRPNGKLVSTVATDKTEEQIPDECRAIWEGLLEHEALTKVFTPAGWYSGAIRRSAQVRSSDALIILGGGEGVEQLAQSFVSARKPVIAFDLNLGSSTGDGNGGARAVFQRAITTPSEFVKLADPSEGGELYSELSLRDGKRDPVEAVAAVRRLIGAVLPPSAFYIRLMNDEIAEYDQVETFFRNVVDPVTISFGFNPIQIDIQPSGYAWINQAIFDQLHYASIVIADLTALRNNCFLELGYALGNAQRTLVTRMKGTHLPFDAIMYDSHEWLVDLPNDERQSQFRDYWQRNILRPPLISGDTWN